MNLSFPLVSILIPCHNAEAWIVQAVESSLAQTCLNAEVIVVDDESTDESLRLLRKFGNQIRLEQGIKRGGNPTRNRLLEMARGEWIQYLDADDYLFPDKIEKQLRVLRDQPDSDVLYGPVKVEYVANGAVHSSEILCAGAVSDDPWCRHLSWNLTQTGGLLVRRNALEMVGGWDESLPCCQDNDLFMRLLMADCRFAYCDHVGAVYRRFEGNTVSTVNPLRLKNQMLDVLAHSRAFLLENKQLTPAREQALNQYRFTLARQMWGFEREWSKGVVTLIQTEMPHFIPQPGLHVPPNYPMLYRLFGFEISERIAAFKRMFNR